MSDLTIPEAPYVATKRKCPQWAEKHRKTNTFKHSIEIIIRAFFKFHKNKMRIDAKEN